MLLHRVKVAIPWDLFADILRMIAEPRPPPLGVKREERSRVVSSSKTTGKVRAEAHLEKPGLYSLIALLASVSLAWADPVPSNRVIDCTYAGAPGVLPSRIRRHCAFFSLSPWPSPSSSTKTMPADSRAERSLAMVDRPAAKGPGLASSRRTVTWETPAASARVF